MADEELDVIAARAASGPAGSLAAAGSLGARAIEAGHEPKVERTGRRFRLVCSCGFSTSAANTRRNAFDALSRHLIDVTTKPRVAPADETPEFVGSPQASGDDRGTS